jgi:predicted  nucleic acid-binding Zn-ribbon protein
MMFLTQMSGTVLQSLRLIDTGGIIMKATIISAVSTGLIAGVFGIISVLITNYFTNKNQLTDLKTNLSRDHVDLSKEHTGLSKEHTGLSKEHAALEKQLSAAQTRLDHLHDESIRMEGFRKDVEKQGVDVTAIKVGIDALAQKNGENITQVRDLTRDLEKSEQKLERSEEELVDVRKELQYYKKELTQSQRENQQLKQQIYNLQHPQQSWDEPER